METVTAALAERAILYRGGVVISKTTTATVMQNRGRRQKCLSTVGRLRLNSFQSTNYTGADNSNSTIVLLFLQAGLISSQARLGGGRVRHSPDALEAHSAARGPNAPRESERGREEGRHEKESELRLELLSPAHLPASPSFSRNENFIRVRPIGQKKEEPKEPLLTSDVLSNPPTRQPLR